MTPPILSPLAVNLRHQFLAIQAVAAYFYAAAPRGVWPIRNGGNETLTYLFVFLYLAAAGAGVWSLDALLDRGKSARIQVAPAA